MLSKRQNSGNKKPAPTLAECRKFTRTVSQALVFQKLCHYCAKPRFEICGYPVSAPTTSMLSKELGLARSTVQSAIRFLCENELIECCYKRFRNSERRYVRIRTDPIDGTKDYPVLRGLEETTPWPLSKPGSDGGPVARSDGAPSEDRTVYKNNNEKKRKKNKKNGGHPPDQGMPCPEKATSPENGDVFGFSNFSFSGKGQGNASPVSSSPPKAPPSERFKPKGLFQKVRYEREVERCDKRANTFSDTLGKRCGLSAERRVELRQEARLRFKRRLDARLLRLSKDQLAEWVSRREPGTVWKI